MPNHKTAIAGLKALETVLGEGFFYELAKKCGNKEAAAEMAQTIGKPKYTGWIFTDTTAHVHCPKCGVAPGQTCIMPKKRKCRTPHGERVREYSIKHPEGIKASERSF